MARGRSMEYGFVLLENDMNIPRISYFAFKIFHCQVLAFLDSCPWNAELTEEGTYMGIIVFAGLTNKSLVQLFLDVNKQGILISI